MSAHALYSATCCDIESPMKRRVSRSDLQAVDEHHAWLDDDDDDDDKRIARRSRARTTRRAVVTAAAFLIACSTVVAFQNETSATFANSLEPDLRLAYVASPHAERLELLDKWWRRQRALDNNISFTRLREPAAGVPRPCAVEFMPAEVAKQLTSDVRTLFIGNSIVASHDLAGRYRALVAAAMPRATVQVATLSEARLSLADHSARMEEEEGKTAQVRGGSPISLLRGRWTHVVLQEQSQLPALLALRIGASHADPAQHEQEHLDGEIARSRAAVRVLAAKASSLGAQAVVLMQTWGSRDGDSRTDVWPRWVGDSFHTFEGMQQHITAGCHALAREARAAISDAPAGFPLYNAPRQREHSNGGGTIATVRVAPVGEAFNAMRNAIDGGMPAKPLAPDLFRRLYALDDAHPSQGGTDLAAAVLMHTLHGLIPSLPPEYGDDPFAHQLRAAAAEAVGCISSTAPSTSSVDVDVEHRTDYIWSP